MTAESKRPRPPRVVWTRGKGCRELAELLGRGESLRIQGDPTDTCIEERAGLLVSRRLPSSFDLVDVAVPLDLDPDRVEAVVAAVAGGPHSVLAAEVAKDLGRALEVPAMMVSAYPPDGEAADAIGVVEDIYPKVPDIEYRTLPAADMAELVAELPDGSLLVFGAPGGSWFQRRLFGPGARLRSRAPAGAVVVQSAPERVFQVMGEPVFVGPLLHVGDTLRIHEESTLAVADGGRLVGLVRRERLVGLGFDTPVSRAMEEPVSIGRAEPVEAAIPLRPIFGPDPIPVIDDEDYLVGGLAPPAA